MRLAVNPTRMELSRLKKRIALARRGHKLLKNKLDELLQKFFPLIHEVQKLREEVNSGIKRAFDSFTLARGLMSRTMIDEAIITPQYRFSVKHSLRVIMNLRVPMFEISNKGNVLSYGFVNTFAELDEALYAYSDISPKMVKLAEVEKAIHLLADEIERTRRRVNALEYILIPNMVETIKYISQKLSEVERGNLTRLMKIKDIVRAH
ncbi:MAG: V-type ATP synthase subunit D [bacterium]